MTAAGFIAGIQDALTPEALSRAVEASRLRKPGVTPMKELNQSRAAWTYARASAKAAVLSDADITTAGTGRDAVWAAVSAAMDAAGAYAVRDHIDPRDFEALLAPWSYMTEGEPA